MSGLEGRKQDATRPRKPYEAPELYEYGDAATLTGSGGSDMPDGSTGSKKVGL